MRVIIDWLTCSLTFVNVHMSMHLVPSGESAPAFLALVRFLPSMQAQVHLQSTWRGEGKWADFTYVRSFASVHTNVSLQATESCKILRTQAALVFFTIFDEKIFYLLTCQKREHVWEGQSPRSPGAAAHVRKHVLLKISKPREFTIALLALVWLTVIMDQQMTLKVTRASEWHHTVAALEWLFFILTGIISAWSGLASRRLECFLQESGFYRTWLAGRRKEDRVPRITGHLMLEFSDHVVNWLYTCLVLWHV